MANMASLVDLCTSIGRRRYGHFTCAALICRQCVLVERKAVIMAYCEQGLCFATDQGDSERESAERKGGESGGASCDDNIGEHFRRAS